MKIVLGFKEYAGAEGKRQQSLNVVWAPKILMEMACPTGF